MMKSRKIAFHLKDFFCEIKHFIIFVLKTLAFNYNLMGFNEKFFSLMHKLNLILKRSYFIKIPPQLPHVLRAILETKMHIITMKILLNQFGYFLFLCM